MCVCDVKCRCPHCKKKCDASKQIHFWRSSDILIVHLKRFGVDENNMRSRLNTLVHVPLGEVDFSPYFASGSPFRDQNNRYRLYAVANHTGG
jgi:ubiquitin C-terminal hydrolase